METPVPQQPAVYQTPPVIVKGRTPYGLYFFIFLLLLLLPVASVGAYYVGSQSLLSFLQPNSTAQITLPNSSPTPTAQLTPQVEKTSLLSSVLNNYLKRQFNMNEFFFAQTTYPTELQVSDSMLVGMNCSERINCNEDFTECTYFPKYANTIEPQTKITEPKILEILKQANMTKDATGPSGNPVREVVEATLCETEDKRIIIEYKTGGGGGGAGSIDYIGVVNPDGTVKKVGSVSENTAFFGCYSPLQLTKDNMLYYRCGGGDGAFGSSSIYKFNLNTSTTEKVLTCTSGFKIVNGVETEEPETICK